MNKEKRIKELKELKRELMSSKVKYESEIKEEEKKYKESFKKAIINGSIYIGSLGTLAISAYLIANYDDRFVLVGIPAAFGLTRITKFLEHADISNELELDLQVKKSELDELNNSLKDVTAEYNDIDTNYSRIITR